MKQDCQPSAYLGLCSCDTHKSQESRGKRRPILTPLYHFHLLNNHYEISQAITAQSLPAKQPL